jgi:hypothetical protein
MEINKINRWEFEREFKQMAISCTGLKENTIKRKASKLFRKYDPIISSSEDQKNYYMKRYDLYQDMFNTLKSGSIQYNNGVILLKSIEQIEYNEKENNITIITKNGRNILMSSDYKYLKDIL